MKNTVLPLLLLLVSVIVLPAIVGCASLAPSSPNPAASEFRPDWIDNPGRGVSAAAGMHVKGKVAQENLAIQRAREEFAKRFGVKVESLQTTTQLVANGRSTSVTSKQMQEETQQSDVQAQVKAKWYDPVSDTLWIWLVPAEH